VDYCRAAPHNAKVKHLPERNGEFSTAQSGEITTATDSDLGLDEIARWTRPILTGCVRYYGRFYPSRLREQLRTIDAFIVRWVSRKYKRFRGHTLAAWDWLRSLKRRNHAMFAHWTLGPAVG